MTTELTQAIDYQRLVLTRNTEAEAAETAATEARQTAHLATARREKAQADLRAAIHAYAKPAPLFDALDSWDAENASHFRVSMERLAAQIHRRREEEIEAKRLAREAAEALAKAEQALAKAIEGKTSNGEAHDAGPGATAAAIRDDVAESAAPEGNGDGAGQGGRAVPDAGGGREQPHPRKNGRKRTRAARSADDKTAVIEPALEKLLEEESDADALENRHGRLERVDIAILGIDRHWRKRLVVAGYETLGDLVDLASAKALPLAEAIGSLLDDITAEGARAIADAALEWLRANPPPHAPGERHCRDCGCIELDCSYCVARTGGHCEWAAEDLCTACDGPNRTVSQAELDALNKQIQDTMSDEQPIEVLEIPISDLGLPNRWVNRLEDAGYRCLGHLWKLGQTGAPLDKQLAEVKGIGPEVAAEIAVKVRERLLAEHAPAPLKGEPIGPLGVSARDLDAAYFPGLFPMAKPGEMIIVKPVTVNARLWVCWAMDLEEQGKRWRLLPLYRLDNSPGGYAAHMGIPANEPVPARLRPTGEGESGPRYEGITVRTGRSKKDNLYVIGPASESRTLVQAKGGAT